PRRKTRLSGARTGHPGRIATQPAERHTRRRVETGHWRQSPSIRCLAERSRGRLARRVFRRRRLLDRSQKRRLDYLNLLSSGGSGVGAEFERQAFFGKALGKVLEPRM